MELFKIKANLFMDFNGNTIGVTPVVMLHISGTRACPTPGKAVTQTWHPVMPPLAARVLEKVEKIF